MTVSRFFPRLGGQIFTDQQQILCPVHKTLYHARVGRHCEVLHISGAPTPSIGSSRREVIAGGPYPPVNSRRTIAAPSASARSLPDAIARGRYFMPQSGAATRRSGAMW